MRITDLNSSQSFLGQIQRLNGRQANLQTQVATGQRISRPSDDPKSTGKVLELQAEKQRIQQYARNGDRALTINQTTYSAISDLKKISDRAGEMGVLGVGVIDPAGSQGYATELNQLIEQGLQRVNASYSGEHIFGGTKTDSEPFAATRDASGKITSVAYAGAADSPKLNVGENSTITPYSSATTNQQLGDFINNLISMRDALSSGSTASVQAAQPGLAASEDHLLGAVSEIGATQTRIEGNRAQSEARFSELEQSTSRETDADLSNTIVKLTQTQTAYQAALQVGAQIMRVSLLDYVR